MTSLPPGWRITTVGEAGHVDLGRQRHPNWHHGPNMRPYLRVANVFEDRIDTSDLKSMDFSGVFDRFRLEPGDVLLTEGQTPELVGRPAIYRGVPENVAFTNSLLRFKAGPDITPEWALIVFRRHMHFGRFTREARITTNIAHLSAGRLKSVEFPIPPLQEQRRIVEILEAHLSRLNAGVSGLEHAERRIDMLEAQTIRAALTGRAVAGPHDVQIRAAGVDDGELTPLPPGGWCWMRLGELADVVGGVTKDSNKQSDPSFIEVPYLRVANVQRGRLDLRTITNIRVTPRKAEALRLLPGDVLLNEGGDRDKLGRGWVWEDQIQNCIHQNHVFRARVRDSRIDPYLLSWAANSIGGHWCERNGKQSVNLASISLSRIRLMPVPVPPSCEQAALRQHIESVVDGCRIMRSEIATSRTRSAALRRSLLEAAFSGRLTGSTPGVEMAEEMAGV